MKQTLSTQCLCSHEVSVIFILRSPRETPGSVFGHSMDTINLLSDLLTQELQAFLCTGASEQLPPLVPAGKEPEKSDDVVHLI